MSSTCGNCDCADKTQCVKKGNSYSIVIMETKSYFDGVLEIAETNPDCKCGSNCTCVDCKCGK